MRLFASFLALGLCAAGAAEASSIVAVEDGDTTPSIVALESEKPASSSFHTVAGDEAPSSEPNRISASIVALPSMTAEAPRVAGADVQVPVSSSMVALGALPPPVGEETVAALDDSEGPEDTGAGNTRRVDFSPMVIRGGIVGDAFVQEVAARSVTSRRGEGEPSLSREQPPRDARRPSRLE